MVDLVRTYSIHKTFESLEEGDLLITKDCSSFTKYNTLIGKEYIPGEFKYILINGRSFCELQSIVCNGRVVHVKDVCVGDEIYECSGNSIRVSSITSESREGFWKLSVNGDHRYILNGIIVHNASRYWVATAGPGNNTWAFSGGGNTNWGSASNTQDNATIPTSVDDVYFDGVGVGAADSKLTANITIKSLDCTGYANTITHNSSVTLTIAGDKFRLSTGMTYTLGSATTSAVSMTSTTGTSGSPSIIDTKGKTVGNFTINGSAGYFKLSSTFLQGATATLTFTTGTLDSDIYDLSFGLFSSANTNTRTINFGSGTWYGLGNAATVWDLTSTNLTVTRGNPVNFNYSGSSGTRTIQSSTGVTATNAIDIAISAGTDAVSLTYSPRHLVLTGFCGAFGNSFTMYGDLTLYSGLRTTNSTGTWTFSGTSTQNIYPNGCILEGQSFTISGSSTVVSLQGNLYLGAPEVVSSIIPGKLTITQGTFTSNGYSIYVDGVSSSNSNTRTANFTNSYIYIIHYNTGWNFSTITNLTFTAPARIIFYNRGGQTSSVTTTTDITFSSSTSLTYNDIEFKSNPARRRYVIVSGIQRCTNVTFSGGYTFNNWYINDNYIQIVLQNSSTTTIKTIIPSTDNSSQTSITSVSTTSNATINLTSGSLNYISFIKFTRITVTPSRTMVILDKVPNYNGGNNIGILFNHPSTYGIAEANNPSIPARNRLDPIGKIYGLL